MIDSDQFKQAMRRLCGSVTIVTTQNGDEKAGLTATAVCSLSAEPPRLLACINRVGNTYRMIERSRSFCINVLAAGESDLASCFAGRASPTDSNRFSQGDWVNMASGTPALASALAAFDCRVSTILDTGSHAVIIGDIIDIRLGSEDVPLLYMNGQFSTLSPVLA